jgi:hypothetical protein
MAIFALPGIHKELLAANVMNLGEGGIGLTFDKSENIELKKGDRLILIEIKGAPYLEFMSNIESEIRWVLDNALLEHTIGFGCQFVGIPLSTQEQIRQVVNSRLVEYDNILV